jgi:uncharacterized membrane protein YsdA (DUF1294 family)
MEILLPVFLLLNTIAFIITVYDKHLAVKNKRRISEKALLSWVAVGGAFGSLVAMLVVNHKISKKIYLLKFFGIVVLQVLIVLSIFYLFLSKN